jgi:diguanylate cyclase (GGDEF)-like protein
MRDLKLILAIDRNRFIIDNLREKFVLVDENNHVVDASSEFEQFLEIDLNKHYTFDQLMTEINKKAVVFKEIEELDETLFDDSKLYLNMYEKDIHLPFFKYSGHFYLFYDDTANQKYVHDMHYVKTHDLMTNLYNRNYIEEMRATLNKKDVYYHLIMFDLDGLKLFNDHLGHQSGDALLKRFANLLKQFQSKEIIPIRLGGDEFLMVFIGQDLKVVHKVIEQLQNSNKNKPFIETLHFSYGIASKTKKNESLNHLMSQVDVLMYKSKHAKDNYKEKLQVKLKEFSIHNKK